MESTQNKDKMINMMTSFMTSFDIYIDIYIDISHYGTDSKLNLSSCFLRKEMCFFVKKKTIVTQT